MRSAALLATLLTPLLAQTPAAPPDPQAQALAWAEQARTLKPKQARIQLEVARAYLATGDLAKAEEAFAKVEVLDPRDSELQVQSLLVRARGGQSDRVLPKVPALIQRIAGDDKALLALAEGLSDLGHAAPAREAMATLLQKQPREWEAFVAYGRACLRAGRREEAAEWFERAVAVKPKNSDIWRAIALALADAGGKPEEVR